MHRNLFIVLVSLSSLVCAGSAFGEPAQTEPPITPEEERLYDEGTKAARANRWAEARDQFRAAFALQSRPRIAALLGRAELELGEHRSAAEHLSFFLREQTNLDAADRQRAEEMLERATSEVATVTVTVDPAAAKVRVDGRDVGASPLAGPVYVDPGTHGFEAVGANGARARVELPAAAGAKHEVTFSLHGGRAPGVAPMNSGLRWSIAGVGLVASMAGLGAGVALWMVAEDERSNTLATRYHEGSLAAFVAGAGLGAATTLFALVTAPGDASEAKVTAAPWGFPGGGGFEVRGVF